MASTQIQDGNFSIAQQNGAAQIDFPLQNSGDYYARTILRECVAVASVKNPNQANALQPLTSYTNLLTYSEDFTNAAWTATAATPTTGALANPADGLVTMNKVLETTANSEHRLAHAFDFTSQPKIQFSCFFKGGLGRDYVRLRANDGTVDYTAFFNLTTGVLGSTSNCTAAITPVGNGIYLCAMVFAPDAAAGNLYINSSLDGAAVSYSGDASRGFYAWGASAVVPTFASSYNPYALPGIAAHYDLSNAYNYITTTANFTGTGTATSTLISTAFVGVSTAFLSELATGDTVYNSSDALIGTILSVTNDTSAVLTANGAAAITGAAYHIKKKNPRVILVADSSGNSAVNVLALNGVTGNYAGVPDAAALHVTGDIDLRAQLSFPNWVTGGGTNYVIAKFISSGNFAYALGVGPTGTIVLTISTTGSDAVTGASTAIVPFAAFATGWIRVTRAQTGGLTNFYTSPDGATWTLLGAANVVISSGTAIFAGTNALTLGTQGATAAPLTGNLLRAQIYNGIAGTLVFDANFATAAKLATSFTESSTNAATVTINTTGDLGARICGARDLVNLTAGKQPTISGSSLLFDGANDYLKAAAFSLSQPESVYFVGQQVAWTSGAVLIDGNSVTTGQIVQTSATPQLDINAGSAVAANTNLALGVSGVASAIFNAASSSLTINKSAATTGNAGAGNMGGFTLGASATPGNYAKIIVNEVAIYSIAHDTTTKNAVIDYLMGEWSIGGALLADFLTGPYVSTTNATRTILATAVDSVDAALLGATNPGDPFAYLVDESAPNASDLLKGFARWDRTYARIPAPNLVYSTIAVTKPSASGAGMAFGNLYDVTSGFGSAILIGPVFYYIGYLWSATDYLGAPLAPGAVYVQKAGTSNGVTPAASGLFQVTFGASTTGALNWNDSGATIATAINGLASVVAAGITVACTNNFPTGGVASLTIGLTVGSTSSLFTASTTSLNPASCRTNFTTFSGTTAQQIVLSVFATITAHGFATSGNLATSNGNISYLYAYGTDWKVIDSNTIAFKGSTFDPSPIYFGQFYRNYTPGLGRLKTKKTTTYYFPGVTGGITTPADIPTPVAALNDAIFLALIVNNLTGYQTYDADPLSLWNWPIYQQTVSQIDMATV